MTKKKTKKNNNIQDSGMILPIIETSSNPLTINFPRSRKTLRAFSAIAVGLDGTYSGFMFETAPKGLQTLLLQLGVELTPAMMNYIMYAAIPFILCNLITDLTAVDIMREADELALAFSNNKTEQTAMRALILGFTLKALAIIGNYPVGASADAIPVADLITEYLTGTSAEALRYSSLIVIGSLEILYYMMFLNGRLQRHAHSLIDTLKNFPEFCHYVAKQPGRYAEVLIQVSANAANRGIAFSFIMEDVLEKFFNISSKWQSSRGLSIAAGVNSAGLTFFSRFLSIYKKFLNQDFQFVSPKEYNQASGLCKELILDSLFSAIRGGSLGMLVYELSALTSPWSYIVTGTVSGLVSLHSGYSNYTMRRYQNALNAIPKDELAQRKESKENIIIDDKIEIAPLLGKKEITDPVAIKVGYFDKIASMQTSRKLEFAVDVVINSTQLVRLMAFWLFVETVNHLLLNDAITPKALFALTLFWGTEVYKNDRALYRDALTGNWTGIAARWQLEKKSAEVNPRHDYVNSRWCNFHTPRAARVFTSSLYDYSDEILKTTLRELEDQDSTLQLNKSTIS